MKKKVCDIFVFERFNVMWYHSLGLITALKSLLTKKHKVILIKLASANTPCIVCIFCS